MSPAFYMIPAIDDYQDNVIYVNQAHMGNTLTLYTTLAHEGYPGHLYQTVYYAGTNPAPIRNILNFGGYVEGWATYAEMCSYSLAPFPKAQAVLLQKNSSILLGFIRWQISGSIIMGGAARIWQHFSQIMGSKIRR